jgi:non-ribosomal peptide synthase protein (TIGR01720 family)
VNLEPDFATSENQMGDAETATAELPKTFTTLLLTEANRAYNTEPTDVLLTALARVLALERGSGKALITLEGHGRESSVASLDISRTVGWLTSIFPFVLDLAGHADAGSQLKAVKESLRRIPRKGIGYGILSQLTPHPAIEVHPRISFNYLGQFDGSREPSAPGWELSGEPTGSLTSPLANRPCELDWMVSSTDGRLNMSLTYNRRQYKRETAARLLESYKRELLHLLDHCMGRKSAEPTVSDLSDGNLTQEEFEELFPH